jgi:hypothetical protein
MSRNTSTEVPDPKASQLLGDGQDSNKQNYRTMSWPFCALIMAAETISLGVLSLPWAMAQLGLIT